jgi:hypothetical protein
MTEIAPKTLVSNMLRGYLLGGAEQRSSKPVKCKM